MVLLAGFSWGLWGQGALECGSIVAPVPTVTDPDSLVYDRFGNAYYWRDLIIKEASVASSLNSPSGCNTGYFNLIFEPEVSTDMRAVANAVFCYLSEVIIQRTNVTPCGETWPQSEVDVHIRMQNLASNIAAQGTSFFSAPNPTSGAGGMRHSRPFMIINGGTATQFGTEIYDAEIDINSNAAVTWNLDWNIPTPPTQHDLFTTILHEALHTLGFASLLSNNGVSIWDVNLFATPEFPATPTHQVLDPINNATTGEESCERNIWSLTYDEDAPVSVPYLNYAANNCMNNLPDIVIGAAGIAPVSGSGGAGLSHLNSTCGGVNYVMDPQLPPGVAGTKRTITAPELEILCALGYQTTTCNGYYSIAHAEETNNMMGCCATPLIVCLNEPGSNIFSMDQLLCNDFSNLPQAVTHIQLAQAPFTPFEISGNNIIVPNGISPDSYRFMYTVTAISPDGPCLMHDVKSTITILDCSPYNCTPTVAPCDNLLCVNDFENLSTGSSMGITTPVITFEGYSEFSTADIITNMATGNNVLNLGHDNTPESQDVQGDTREAVTYQLADGIPPGCSLIIDLDVAHNLYINVPVPYDFSLNFWGSTTTPCSTNGVITRINNSCDVDNLCTDGSVFHPYCMGALTGTNSSESPEQNPLNLGHRTVIWENNTNETIQFLTIVAGTEEERGAFVIDNLEARIECRPVISCRLVNEEDICSEGISTLTWELCSGVGTSLTTNITLPAGVTAVDPNQLSQTIQIPEDGGCIEVSIDITTTIADGGHFLAVISGSATGICANMDFGCKEDLSVVDCEPDPCVTTCALTTTELCSDQPTILTWRVCADGAVGSGTSTATVNITLPQGVTAVNPAQLTQTVQIPAGECVEVSVEVTTTLAVGSPVLLSLTGVASGTCAEAAFGCDDKIMVIDCTPDPLCNCPSTQSLTITASATGSLYSELEALHNYDQNDDGTISFSEHNGCIAISGQLIIDRDVKIEGANMLMAPCSEIFVNRQNTTGYPTLSLEFDHIQACSIMWKGITVGNNCRLEMHNGSIRDAEFAVRAPGGSDVLAGPYTSIDLNNMVFTKNHVGIYMGRPGIKSWVSHGVLRNLTFIGNVTGETLLPPCTTDLANYNAGQGYAGIVAQSLASLSVGPIAGTGYSNYFQNIRNGIISEGPMLYAYWNSFENVGTFGGSTPIGVGTPSYLSSKGIAIMSSNRTATVKNCRFRLCDHGIYGINNTNINVQNNQFNGVNIAVNAYKPGGFYIVGNTNAVFRRHFIHARIAPTSALSKYVIANNTGTGGPIPLLPQNSGPGSVNHAISISSLSSVGAPPAIARISGNTLSPTISGGIKISGMNGWIIDDNMIGPVAVTGIDLSGSKNCYLFRNTVSNIDNDAYRITATIDTRYCCNTATNTWYGFHFTGSCLNTKLRNTDFNGPHVTSILCDGGTELYPQYDYGNIFEAPSGDVQHSGSDLNVQNSQFRVLDDEVPHDPPGGVYTPNQMSPWFVYDGNEIACDAAENTDCVPPGQVPEAPLVNIKEDDRIFAEGDHAGDKYGDMLQWEGERRLYALLAEHPDLITPEDKLNKFIEKCKGKYIDEYHAIDQAIQFMYEIPSYLAEPLHTIEENIQAQSENLEALFAELKTAETHSDSLEILKKIELLQAERDKLIDQQQPLLSDMDVIRAVRLQMALNLAQNLPGSSVQEKNRQTVLNIYLQTLAQDILTLTPEQLAEISPVAHQCMLEGGNAVLDARMLYQMYEAKIFNDAEICEATEEREDGTKNTLNPMREQVLLIPNPANSQIQIIGLEPVTGQPIKVSLININGKTVFGNTLETGQNTLQTGHLPEGVYFCRIWQGEHQISFQKVVILH